MIRHDRAGVSSPLYTVYAHLNSALSVSVGTAVSTGQKLGVIAQSGSSGGPHVHFLVSTCASTWWGSTCTIWNGPDTTSTTVYKGSAVPGTYSQLASSYIGSVVQWVNGGGQPNTSWTVSSDGRRYWVPNTDTFYCMVGIGYVNRGPQSAAVLDSLPDSGQWASCPVQPRGAQDTLYVNQGLYQGLYQGQAITSNDGRFTLILQQDHNLVLYGPTGAAWATNRWTGGFVKMQGDGNFVAYNMWASPQWATNTSGAGNNCAIVVQNDGNLVIYCDGVAKWDRYSGRLY